MDNKGEFNEREFWRTKVAGVTDVAVLAERQREFLTATNGRSLSADEFSIQIYLKDKVKSGED